MVYFRIIIDQTKKVYCDHSHVVHCFKMYFSKKKQLYCSTIILFKSFIIRIINLTFLNNHDVMNHDMLRFLV